MSTLACQLRDLTALLLRNTTLMPDHKLIQHASSWHNPFTKRLITRVHRIQNLYLCFSQFDLTELNLLWFVDESYLDWIIRHKPCDVIFKDICWEWFFGVETDGIVRSEDKTANKVTCVWQKHMGRFHLTSNAYHLSFPKSNRRLTVWEWELDACVSNVTVESSVSV